MAIMNNVVMNVCVQVLCRSMLSLLFSVHLGVELLGHKETLTFEELPDYNTKWLHHFT